MVIKGAVLDWLGGPVWAIVRPALPFIAGTALILAAWAYADHRGYQRGVASQQPAIAALNATIANVRNASAAALASDLAKARTVETKQREITDASSSDYQRQLADLRARYDRLRAEAAADSRGGAGTDMPGVSDATSRPDATAPQIGLPDALIASEQALQLQALQGWIAAQTKVDR